jgi:hypothetical protein
MEQSSARALGCCGASVSPEFKTRSQQVVRNRIPVPPPVVCSSFTREPLGVNFYRCFGYRKRYAEPQQRPRTNSSQSNFARSFLGWQDSILREPTVCIHLLLSLRLRVSETLFHGHIRTDVVRSDRKSRLRNMAPLVVFSKGIFSTGQRQFTRIWPKGCVATL